VDGGRRVAVQVGVAGAGEAGGQLRHRAGHLRDQRRHRDRLAAGCGDRVGSAWSVTRQSRGGEVGAVGDGVRVGERGDGGAQRVRPFGLRSVAEPRGHARERGRKRRGERGGPAPARGRGAPGGGVEQVANGQVEQGRRRVGHTATFACVSCRSR
jgi:hypothetical protein